MIIYTVKMCTGDSGPEQSLVFFFAEKSIVSKALFCTSAGKVGWSKPSLVLHSSSASANIPKWCSLLIWVVDWKFVSGRFSCGLRY